MNPTNAIAFRGVGKVFVTDADREVVALDSIDLTVTGSEFVAVLGPTGCGKTTLLNLAAGLEQPTSGHIDLAEGLNPGQNIPCVFQSYTLFPWRDVLHNVTFALEMQGVRHRECTCRAVHLLEKVGLQSFQRAYPHELSGGMRQRAAIAQALAINPQILLMDEPFGALDDGTRRTLQTMIVELWQETGMTIVFVTHNIEEALRVAGRVVVLSAHPGRVVLDLPVTLHWPRDTTSEEFFSHYRRIRRGLVGREHTAS